LKSILHYDFQIFINIIKYQMRSRLVAPKSGMTNSSGSSSLIQRSLNLGKKGYARIKAILWIGGVSLVLLVLPVAFGTI